MDQEYQEHEGLSEEALGILTGEAQEEQGAEEGQETPAEQNETSQPKKEEEEYESPETEMAKRFNQYEQKLNQLYQNEVHAAQTISQQRAEIAALRARFQEFQPQPQKPEEEPYPEDPMERMVEQRVRTRMAKLEEDVRKRQQEELAPVHQSLRQQQMQAAWNQRAQASQEAARQRYTDYDDVAMEATPWLQAQQKRANMGDPNAQAFLGMITASPDPAEVLYTLGLRFRFEKEQAQKQNQPARNPVQRPEKNQPKPQTQESNVVQFPRGADIPGGAGGGSPELDLKNITSKEWSKLPEDVRLRILRGE